MRISNQPQINPKPKYLPNFKSNTREITDAAGKVVCRNYTNFFRSDLNWEKFVDFLAEKYKNTKKVNVYCYACSDGSEPYSLAMILMKKLGMQKAQKFFPIQAMDIDEEILKGPSKGILMFDRNDFSIFKRRLGSNYFKYLSVKSGYRDIEGYGKKLCVGSAKTPLLEAVRFKKANIIEDIKNVEENDSVILCRNFWPYLSTEEQIDLSSKIRNKLKKNSMFVIGEYDFSDFSVLKNIASKEFDCKTFHLGYIRKPEIREGFLGIIDSVRYFLQQDKFKKLNKKGNF